MALSSDSTDAQVNAQFDDNARYWESADKAANFYEAVLVLLRRYPIASSAGGRSLSRADLLRLQDEVLPYVKAGQTSTRAVWTKGKPV